MPYNTGNNIDLSNDREEESYPSTNLHIHDMNNPGEESDSSKFSGGSPEKRHQQQSNDDKKVARKRQQTKNKLAADQSEKERRRDNQRQSEGYSLVDAYEHTSRGTASKCFDGIRTDRPTNEAAAAIVDKVRHLSTSNDDDHHSRQRKKAGRAKNHNTSAFANLEKIGSTKKESGWRGEKQHDHSPLGSAQRSTSNFEDPLDEAAAQQGMYRNSSRGSHNSNDITKRMGCAMNNIVQAKYGTGSMATKRQKQKKKSKARSDDVIDVDIDARNEGSVKKRKTSPHFENSNRASSSQSSSSSVNQGDDGFYAEGGWDSQGSGAGHKDEIRAALDGANQYVQPRDRKKLKKAKQKTPSQSTSNFNFRRDPEKNGRANRGRCKYRVVIVVSCSRFIAKC